jgi:hypothetical protein
VNVFFDELRRTDEYCRCVRVTFFLLIAIERLHAVDIDVESDGLVKWAIVSEKSLSVANESLNDDIDKRSGGRVIDVYERFALITSTSTHIAHASFSSSTLSSRQINLLDNCTVTSIYNGCYSVYLHHNSHFMYSIVSVEIV